MYTQNSPIHKHKHQFTMNSKFLYLLVIFTFLLPISLACDFRHEPMNGICTPCGPYCISCYGDPNYCTQCNHKAIIRGKCQQCDDIGCKSCYHSSECTECKDGFYPEPSPEGDCLPCPADCPYCGHNTWDGWHVDVCEKCEDPGEGYNRSTCTPCPKNCNTCGMTHPPIKEFKCSMCEDGYTLSPTKESCTVCLIDNCRSCEFESLDKCTDCIHGMYLHEGKCVINPPNCEDVKSDSDPVECKICNPYFYLTPDKVCKPIPQEGCRYWDDINLKCMDGCWYDWDYKLGVCTRCERFYFPLTTYANISSHKYERCNLTCNTVTYSDYSIPYCLTENKCPPGYYLNKYRNCVSCGGNYCTDCTDEGCVTSANKRLIELFAEDWKGKGKSFGRATDRCDNGKYRYNEEYCFKDKCPSGMEVKGNNTCEGGSPAAYGVSFSLIFIFIILMI